MNLHLRLNMTAAILVAATTTFSEEIPRKSVTLVQDGNPRSTIVLGEKPTRSAQLAAKELQYHVQLITGASLAISQGITRPDGPLPIYVGESEQTRKLGYTSDDFREQESYVHVTGKHILLIGRDWSDTGTISYEKTGGWEGLNIFSPAFHVGTLYAVYDFLEALCGVRWFMVTDTGTFLPHSKTLNVNVTERRRKPWTTYRVIGRGSWAKPGTFGRPDGMGYERNSNYGKARDNTLYQLRTRQNGSSFQFRTHTLAVYNKRHSEEHPDWFVDGKPGPNVQLRLWTPEVVEQVSRDIEEYFKRPYEERVVGDPTFPLGLGNACKISPLDNRNFGDDCQPPRQPERKGGFADGQYSNYWFTFVKRVAEVVGKSHPDKWISAPAYASHFEPPTFDLPSNVGVHVANTEGWKPDSYGMRTLREWRKRVTRLFVYEYWYSKGRFPKIRPHELADYVQQLKELNIEGWQMEFFGSNPAAEHLDFYVATKMLFEPEVNVDELLKDYFEQFYGSAKDPMRKFWNIVQRQKQTADTFKHKGRTGLWHELDKIGFIRDLDSLLTQAASLAGTGVYGTRVRIVRTGLYEMLQQRIGESRAAYSPGRRLACPFVASSPEIDGRVSAEEWKSAATTEVFVRPDSFPATASTVARMMRDTQHLYVAFICNGDAPPSQEALRRRTDAPQLLRDDGVRIALDIGRTRREYFLIAINPHGDIYDAIVTADLGKTWRTSHMVRDTSPAPGWQSGVETAVSIERDQWTVEAKIPLKNLGLVRPAHTGPEASTSTDDWLQHSRPWGLNLARVQTDSDSTRRLSMWSPTFNDFNFPDEFGACEWRNQLQGDAPIIHYDFEEDFITTKRVVDVAGVKMQSKVQTSPGVLKTARGGHGWSASNVVEGISGKGIRFEGKKGGQFLQVEFASAVNLVSDDFTVAFWYRPNAPVGNPVASMVNTRGNHPYWHMSFSHNDSLSVSLNTGFEEGVRGPAAGIRLESARKQFVDGKWHHFVVMVDRGSAMRFYVDGTLRSLVGSKMRNVKAALPRLLSIGTYYSCIDGDIDEFKVFVGTFGEEFVMRLYKSVVRNRP